MRACTVRRAMRRDTKLTVTQVQFSCVGQNVGRKPIQKDIKGIKLTVIHRAKKEVNRQNYYYYSANNNMWKGAFNHAVKKKQIARKIV